MEAVKNYFQINAVPLLFVNDFVEEDTYVVNYATCLHKFSDILRVYIMDQFRNL